MSILYFVVVLGVLILIHELGHFLIARRVGIRVEAFAIGFGPRLFGFRQGETEFKICLFPLGGYVKMVGEDPEDARADDPNAFTAKSVPARFGVVAAGPVMNFLLACCLMPCVFLLGRSEPAFFSQAPMIERICPGSPAAIAGLAVGDRIVRLDGKPMRTWEQFLDERLLASNASALLQVERGGTLAEYRLPLGPPMAQSPLGIEPQLFVGDTTIAKVAPEGPAAAAGLAPGDRVRAVGGTPVEYWQCMANLLHQAGGSSVALLVERGGGRRTVTLTPTFHERYQRHVIGIEPDPERLAPPMVTPTVGLVGSVVRGEKEIYKLTILTFRFLKRLITSPSRYFRALGGPIQIAQASVAAAERGLAPLLWFAAFLSLQLAILNLLPIPVLDGGHLLFLGIEAIRGRPLSARARARATYVGLAFLLTLLCVVTFNDLDNLLGLRRWMGR